ncbi:MAG TPA: 16S rRNA (guanine(966)-N(2))-methyltransferase RsmD [Selenomonas sp.]|nr:16S rRNA (guanine(966)-N(2))-methyltransferase RsmD [Selenomonas sp.]
MRIIAGTARGRQLKTPKGAAVTRPTADRVKESLFNILGDMVQGRTVLDICAGTGNLGLESLSRGAEKATFIDRATAGLILDNAARTKCLQRCEVCTGDAIRVLRRMAVEGREFGLIFCDPPYHEGVWQQVLSYIDEGHILSQDGILVVEHGADENDLPALQRLERRDNRSYGHTTQLSFFQWQDYGLYAEEEA